MKKLKKIIIENISLPDYVNEAITHYNSMNSGLTKENFLIHRMPIKYGGFIMEDQGSGAIFYVFKSFDEAKKAILNYLESQGVDNPIQYFHSLEKGNIKINHNLIFTNFDDGTPNLFRVAEDLIDDGRANRYLPSGGITIFMPIFKLV